jgi:hypothetical protein
LAAILISGLSMNRIGFREEEIAGLPLKRVRLDYGLYVRGAGGLWPNCFSILLTPWSVQTCLVGAAIV